MKTTIIIFSITLLASIVSSQQACNGYPELCNKLYSDVAYPTTHNSYAFMKSPASNQNYDIPTQLKDGVRGLMLDAWFPDNNPKEVHLCHSTCNLLDDGPAKDTLSQIVTWLGDNPNEVLTILWENSGQPPVPASAFNDFYNQSGLNKFAYVQGKDQAWPSLSTIIASGKRVVNFIDTGADPSFPWLMGEYDYVFETPFENTDINSFNCLVDRPKNQTRPMYVLNHFTHGVLPSGIDLPLPDKAKVVNSDNLVGHAQKCQQTFSKIPNFVAVDFYDQGVDDKNIFSAVAGLNNVKYVSKPLGDGKAQSPNNGTNNNGSNNNGSKKNNAPGSDLRKNLIFGLAGVGTLAILVL